MSAMAEWKLEAASRDKSMPPCGDAAFNLAAAGRNQEALDCLELAVDMGNPNMPYLGVFEIFRSLRDEPRFQELLQRMNLPPAAAF